MVDTIHISDFDDVFAYIGGFGLFQFIIYVFVCAFCFLYGFIYYGQIFMVLTPPHWCSPPPDFQDEMQRIFYVNLTAEEVKALTIPLLPNGLDYSKCHRYDISPDMVEYVNGSFSFTAEQVPRTECTYGWSYNYSMYYPSITSQLDWVCDDDWKPPFAQACFFIGSMIGIPICGWLADFYGRIPIIVATNLLGGAVGIASSFCGSFSLFCVLRCIVGLAHDSNFLIAYILGLEYVSTSYRSLVANVPIMIFLTGSMCSLPWIAYFLADWTLYGVAIHSPFFIAVFLPWLAPESARWLLSRGKSEKVTHIVEHAAKLNGKELSEEFRTSFENYAEKVSLESSSSVSWLDLLKLPTLRKRFLLLCTMWISIFLTYDGYVRHTENIGTNFFISFTLMGAVEFPGDLLTIFLVEYFGRRHTTVCSLILTGLVSWGIIPVPESDSYSLLGLAVLGRFLITISINVGTQYIIEVLPTVGRAQGSGAIHTVGMGMAFVSPYIVYLVKYQYWLPYFMFGIISITGGLLCSLLPETLGEKLPDSLQDGEGYFKNQPFFYNPWRKNQAEKMIKTTQLRKEKDETNELNTFQNSTKGYEKIPTCETKTSCE